MGYPVAFVAAAGSAATMWAIGATDAEVTAVAAMFGAYAAWWVPNIRRVRRWMTSLGR